MLKQPADKAKAKNVLFSVKVVYNTSSSNGIVFYANANNLDLVVMGSHSRTGFRKIVLGSVANGVLINAKCPVLNKGVLQLSCFVSCFIDRNMK